MNTTNWMQRGFAVDPAKDENLILNAIPYPILVFNNDDFITYANSGAEQFFAKGAVHGQYKG